MFIQIGLGPHKDELQTLIRQLELLSKHRERLEPLLCDRDQTWQNRGEWEGFESAIDLARRMIGNRKRRFTFRLF